MQNILLSTGLAFLITFFAIPVIIEVAKNKKLFDEPDERKVHKAVIPTLGGLGIFAGFILATLMGVPANISNQLQYFMAAALVIFFLGIKDDILVLSATKKFIGQLIAAGIIIRFGGIQINNMHGLFGINEIPHFASVILTLFTIIVITNSFNLIDGVDGLAGSLGLLTSIVFGVYFLMIGQLMFAVMALSLAGSLGAFLIFNFSPAKIFMGDTGSLMLGFLIAILSIKFVEFNKFNAITNAQPVFRSAPAMVCGLLIVPIFDTLRVFTLRLIKGVSPFNADRNHIHHRLIDFKLSHIQSSGVLAAINLFFIAIVYLLQDIGTLELFMFISILALTLNVISWHFANLHTRTELNSGNEEEVMELDNVVSLAKKNIFSHEFKKKFNHPL